MAVKVADTRPAEAADVDTRHVYPLEKSHSILLRAVLIGLENFLVQGLVHESAGAFGQ
jgi:hypothetical protein